MILENPALALSIGAQDILDILEDILKEKNWQKFEVANLKLTYVPFYIFNYDTLLEKKVEDDTTSQGFAGVMAMNAITGKLEPYLTQILSEQPVNYEREISHDIKYEMLNPSITMDEMKESSKIKLAAQFNVGKAAMSVSGISLTYWPIWKIFVTLPTHKVQRIEVEAVSGSPMNIEEVPEREKTWMEVTQDSIGKLKTPEGWAELSKTAIKTTGSMVAGAAKASGGSSGVMDYFKTKTGMYVLIGAIILIALIVLL